MVLENLYKEMGEQVDKARAVNSTQEHKGKDNVDIEPTS